MSDGLKFNELNVTTDINNLLGVAESPVGTGKGYQLVYSKAPNKTVPSDAIVLTEKAVVDMDVYQNPLPTTTAISLPAGSTFFNTAKTFAEFIDYTAYAYVHPAFTAFSLSGYSVVEVGTKITGMQNFAWAISNIGNVTANSINITDITNGLPLVIGHSVASPATYDFTAYPGGGLELDVHGSVTFQIQGTDTQSTSFTRPATVAWNSKWYSGAYANTTFASNADILALSSSALATSFPGQVTMLAAGYFHLVIPTSWTQPTVFKNHATGFSIGTPTVNPITVTNSKGIPLSYNDYCSPQSLSSPITVDIS
jgi:hypothetical protein